MTAQRSGKVLKIVSATSLATFSAVARYVTLCNVSCNLCRNGVVRQVAR